MERLELYQMENLQGGKLLDCVFAVGGIITAAASASTIVGMGLAVFAMSGAIYSAHRCIEDINKSRE